ncbi:SRPBCC family protein [Arthrobacter sp. SA17]
MAFAEYEVLIQRDAISVYRFLADGLNLPLWSKDVRSIELLSGAPGAKGSVYQQTIAGPGGRPVACDFQITQVRPGAEIQFQVIAGPAQPRGGYYLSSEGKSTRVRFALEYQPKGLMGLVNGAAHQSLKTEVAQLELLKVLLEKQAPEE